MADKKQFEINGLIDTSNNVWDNVNEIANASGCFVTWDASIGKWSVILNTDASSVKSFDDSNIIGEINVSGTGVTELYNKASITFPNKDTRDTTDVIEVEIDSAERYPQELDNTLEIQLPIVNDPVHAQYIATRELKQSRLDLIVEFRSNFTANNLKAGELVSITNSGYGFSNKLFRIIQIEEQDEDDGNVIFSILAQEYSADIYDADLSYEYRSSFNGIQSQVFNAEIQTKDDFDFSNSMGRLLAANLGLGLLRSLFTSDEDTGEVQQELFFDNQPTQELFTAGVKLPSLTHSASGTDVCDSGTVQINFSHNCSNCFFNTPDFTYTYEITGANASEVSIPLEGEIVTSGNSASISFDVVPESEKTITFTMGDTSTDINVQVQPDQYITGVSANPGSITEGETVAVTVNTFGYNDGSTLNYAITGSASGKVTSPALTGTVTINTDTASLSIVTQDDATFNEPEELTVTFTPQPTGVCFIGVDNSVDITVANDATTGPDPGPDPGDPEDDDYFCEFVEVPLIYCGRFDNDTQYLKSVSVLQTVLLPKAPTGGTAVPLTISVTDPNTSSAAISIDSTVNVEPSGIGASGMTVEVITAFDPVPAGGDTLITGTTATLQGYFG